jgi:hypothetical protein
MPRQNVSSEAPSTVHFPLKWPDQGGFMATLIHFIFLFFEE